VVECAGIGNAIEALEDFIDLHDDYLQYPEVSKPHGRLATDILAGGSEARAITIRLE